MDKRDVLVDLEKHDPENRLAKDFDDDLRAAQGIGVWVFISMVGWIILAGALIGMWFSQ
jgi:hypothetical protein